MIKRSDQTSNDSITSKQNKDILNKYGYEVSTITPGQGTKTFSSAYELETYLQALQGAENSEFKKVIKVPRAITRAGSYQIPILLVGIIHLQVTMVLHYCVE